MDAFYEAKEIVRILQAKGFIAYFAGGWVRDFLLKQPSDDIDIATDASPEVVQALFLDSVPIGLAFGIILVLRGAHQFEVATFRKDFDYRDGRHPGKVEFATSMEDAKRRDFTINGMFYDPLKEQIFDFIGGRIDLEKKIIRAIGNPHERFKEDRLRMIRAVRLACKLNFAIDLETQKSIKENAAELFPSVAIERVWKELTKMAENDFNKAILWLCDLDLLTIIFPTLKGATKAELIENLKAIAFFPLEAPPIAKILELFPESALEDRLALCQYFKLSNKETSFVELLFEGQKLTKDEKTSLWQWAHFFAKDEALVVIKIIASHYIDAQRQVFLTKMQELCQKLEKPIQRIIAKKPLITAMHLQKIGIKSGRKLGLLLKEAEKIAIDQMLEDPEQIITILKKQNLWSQSENF